jgi:hypothetical protein
MSRDPNDPDDDGKRVRDEEGSVDEKLKDRIIAARQRVDEREDSVFVEAPLEGAPLNQAQLVQIWSTTVKQYLRSIEPLLRSDDVSSSTYYYHEIPIVDETVHPKDGEYSGTAADEDESHEYRWSLFRRDGVSPRQAIEAHDHNMITRAFDPPKPKKIEIHGLLDVLEKEGVKKEWNIVTNPDAIPPRQNMVSPVVGGPLERPWLSKAVRTADAFLQQAGISIDVGFQSADDPEENSF